MWMEPFLVGQPWWWLPNEEERENEEKGRKEGDEGSEQGKLRQQGQVPHPAHYGFGLHMPQWWHLPYFLHPQHRETRPIDPSTGVSEVTFDKDKFQIRLSVPHFTSKDLKIRITENHELIVDGCHEEKEDEHGLIARSFSRKYLLPKDVEPDKVQSVLMPDGILIVSAPRKPPAPEKEIQVPILEQVEAENKPLP